MDLYTRRDPTVEVLRLRHAGNLREAQSWLGGLAGVKVGPAKIPLQRVVDGGVENYNQDGVSIETADGAWTATYGHVITRSLRAGKVQVFDEAWFDGEFTEAATDAR